MVSARARILCGASERSVGDGSPENTRLVREFVPDMGEVFVDMLERFRWFGPVTLPHDALARDCDCPNEPSFVGDLATRGDAVCLFGVATYTEVLDVSRWHRSVAT